MSGIHSILIVAPSPPPSGGMALQARLLERLLREDGLAVSFLASNCELPRILRACHRVPGLRTLLRFQLMWMALWRHVKQVQVVHVFAASWLYFFAVVFPAIVIGRICGRKTVLNYRGGEAARFFERWGWLAKPVFRAADVITAPSEFLAEVIRRSFDVPVRIVPNILDVSAFCFRQRAGFRPTILVTRNLERMYNVESVLRAFGKVREWYPDASLWIAGSGSDEPRLRGLAAGWKLDNVRFLGHVAHSELPAIYRQCDILMNASRVDNFPAALVEGSAAGLVVVSTATGGIPFIYRNDDNALLVSPDDWQALAEAVDRIVQCPSLAQRLTKSACALVHQCAWENVRKELYAVYGFAFRETGVSAPESNCVLQPENQEA